MSKQLITTDEAPEGKCQHVKACSDCPWAKDSLNGWLGSLSADEWIQVAHGEVEVPCHAIKNTQCAGIAIYRSNVCKMMHDPNALDLPKDKVNVFANPGEFLQHHKHHTKTQ